jgi:hypothetical protein
MVSGYYVTATQVFGIFGGANYFFRASGFPTFTYTGKADNPKREYWTLSWHDPITSIRHQVVAFSVFSEAITVTFGITANRYSCELDDGSAGPTLPFPS